MVNNNKMELIQVTQIQTQNLDDQIILSRACSLTKNWKKIFSKIAQKFVFCKNHKQLPEKKQILGKDGGLELYSWNSLSAVF